MAEAVLPYLSIQPWTRTGPRHVAYGFPSDRRWILADLDESMRSVLVDAPDVPQVDVVAGPPDPTASDEPLVQRIPVAAAVVLDSDTYIAHIALLLSQPVTHGTPEPLPHGVVHTAVFATDPNQVEGSLLRAVVAALAQDDRHRGRADHLRDILARADARVGIDTAELARVDDSEPWSARASDRHRLDQRPSVVRVDLDLFLDVYQRLAAQPGRRPGVPLFPTCDFHLHFPPVPRDRIVLG